MLCLSHFAKEAYASFLFCFLSGILSLLLFSGFRSKVGVKHRGSGFQKTEEKQRKVTFSGNSGHF